ncbi:helix-hairpin-helix domain-containing protein [Myxococcota bacterium]|nr:helix-hairpin-helix domain-containing protein [Myxococcota bacterium]
MDPVPTNDEIADVFEQVATLLRAQLADPYRVRAWQQGADFVRVHPQAMADILAQGGIKALVDLPHIGKSLAAAIDELCHRGRLALLERLEGSVSPEDLFTTIPGIGEELAHAIHQHLHVDTLEELELAAHDGRLAAVPGIGPRRAAGIRDHLDAHLSRSARRRGRPARPHPDGADRPPVELLLELDRRYREQARAGSLPTMRPRRFNPEGASWLPVLHAHEQGWDFTLMFSNTARAHQLGRTRDWVVVYASRDGHEDQGTVVTEVHGPRAGRRVVRGREEETPG